MQLVSDQIFSNDEESIDDALVVKDGFGTKDRRDHPSDQQLVISKFWHLQHVHQVTGVHLQVSEHHFVLLSIRHDEVWKYRTRTFYEVNLYWEVQDPRYQSVLGP